MVSIKTRITVAVLGILLLVLWTTAFIVGSNLQNDMERELGDQQLATVRLVASQADALLTERIRALEVVADAIDDNKILSSLSLEKFLDNQLVLQNYFNRGVMAHRRDGTVVADTLEGGQRIGVNYMDSDSVFGAILDGTAKVGRPVIGRTLGVPIFAISVPIRNAKSEVVGALSGTTELGLPNFLDQITHARYGRTGGYLIVDPKGRVIVAATDKSRVMERSPDTGTIPAIDRFLSGDEGSAVFVNPKGVEVLQSSALIPSSGWYVAAALPISEAFAPIQKMKERLLLVILFLTILSGGLVWWVLRKQLTPLLQTAKSVQAMSENYLPVQPLPLTTNDEIGYLVSGFNRLIESLAKREKELQESDAGFRDSFQKNLCVMLYVDPETGEIFDANQSAIRYLGYARDQLIGMQIAQIDALPRENLDETLRSAMVEGLDAVQSTYRLASGEIRDVETYLTPIEWHGRSLLLSIVHDISERKRIQAKITEISQRLSLATAAAKLGIWDWNVKDDTMHWDDRMYELYGVTRDATPNTVQAWINGLHPADKDRAISECQVALRGEKDFETSFRVLHPDGLVKYLKADGIVIFGQDGRPERMLGINCDISANKKEEEELLSANQRLRLQFEQAPLAVIEWDESLRVAKWNPEATRIFGFPAEEALGRQAVFLFPEAVCDAVGDSIVQLVSGIGGGGGTNQNVRKDGKIIDCQWYSAALRNLEGEVIGAVSLVQDVTEQKAVQAEIEHHRSHLEQLVESRTAELVEAKRLAEEGNRSKSTFLANMSHEIRTPLNAIIGMTQILQRGARRGELTEPQANRVDKIGIAAHHLLRLINDVLELSKIEAGKLDLEYFPFDMDDLLADVESIMRDRACAKGLAFSIEKDPSVSNICADQTRLKQILLNFIGNAIKFTDVGFVRVRVTREETLEAAAVVRFEVEDSGAGIRPEVMSRLFVPFEQVHQQDKVKRGGTGLGLAISKSIAETMGGEVGVSSIPDSGTTFWMTVPLPERERREASRHNVDDSSGLIRQRHTGKRILVVDDEALNQEIAQFYLEEAGLAVDVAVDGLQALCKAKTNAYSLILMDLRLPLMDGIEATRQIRNFPGCRYTPILAITANAFAEDRKRCVEAGMNDFIAKPFKSDFLMEKVLKWLDGALPPDGINESLVLGIPSIDKAHAELVSQIDKLVSHSAIDETNEDFMRNFDRLGVEIRNHFCDEENVFRSLPMPVENIERHTKAHTLILEEYERTNLDLMHGKIIDRIEFLRNLERWLIDHILTYDKGIADYI